jgi:hypothetical protein
LSGCSGRLLDHGNLMAENGVLIQRCPTGRRRHHDR